MKGWLFVRSELDDAGLSAAAFRVLAHLSRRAGGDGRAFPSVPSIARVCCLNKQTVWRALMELESCRLLRRKANPGRPNYYFLTPPAPMRDPAPVGGRVESVSGPDENEVRQPDVYEGRHPDESEGHEGDPPKDLQLRKSKQGERLHTHATLFPSWGDLSGVERAKLAAAGGDETNARASFERFRARKINYADTFPDRTAFVIAAEIELERTRRAAKQQVLEISGWYQFLCERAERMGMSAASVPTKWIDLSDSQREIVFGQRAIVTNFAPPIKP